VIELAHLNLEARPSHIDNKQAKILEGAGGVFFTGGDQLQITSKLGGTQLCEQIHDVYRNGGVIAGTSAGASVLTETMIVSGGEEGTHRIDQVLELAPGLGFLAAMVIDQHFAERGRVACLLGVVAHNPRALGIGVDENTAIESNGAEEFQVLGDGAVYLLDARPMSYTNVSESDRNKTLSAFGVTLHLLSEGDRFGLKDRQPIPPGEP
jgi:cyanophycinase